MSEHLLVDDPAEPRPPRPRRRRTVLVAAALLALVAVAGVLLARDRDSAPPPEPTRVRNGIIVGKLDGRPTVLSGRMGLPRDAGADTTFQFTRDGSELVYVDRRERVVAWDVLAAITRVLVPCPNRSWCRPVLSPDGRTLAVQGRGERLRTVLVDVESGEQRPYPFDHDGVMTWSPDGTRAAVMTERALWVIEVSTGAERRVDPFPEPSRYLRRAQWSPDGTRVAYVREERVGRDRGIATKIAFTLVVVAADGSRRQELLDLGECVCMREPVPDVAWSPDGARLAVTDLSRGGAYTYAVDGTDPVWISAPANELAWRPVVG